MLFANARLRLRQHVESRTKCAVVAPSSSSYRSEFATPHPYLTTVDADVGVHAARPTRRLRTDRAIEVEGQAMTGMRETNVGAETDIFL